MEVRSLQPKCGSTCDPDAGRAPLHAVTRGGECIVRVFRVHGEGRNPCRCMGAADSGYKRDLERIGDLILLADALNLFRIAEVQDGKRSCRMDVLPDETGRFPPSGVLRIDAACFEVIFRAGSDGDRIPAGNVQERELVSAWCGTSKTDQFIGIRWNSVEAGVV